MSIRLYIGNLPKEVMERQELQDVFQEEGDSVTTKLITDRKTGKCRGFGFVTVKNDEQADQIIEKYNGFQFRETPLKIEKALPRSKNKTESENTEAETPKTVSKNNPSKSKKSRRDKDKGGVSKTSSGSSNSNESVQPDPRWADALAELKQRLAASTNS
ncbi:RNA-binding region RNP-1 [Trichodesmium erythraeum IMS101]|uniref:RNA-binding region RNP-1 n=1 Tax=Trichodesmium erythraeum (strain IMS101) TaxID=203124 RepID=Q10XJ6_TRIEI|nr:RNA-binding protein [Trichodesmium erythraeum GBRTRLIN201]MCH2048329.1 RNA-binding protein [Trichodesmium sp. ALOHA_ZT_67]MDE5095356.1 RNA-binding protein [Trichodesmium sp. St11_bin5]